MQWNSTIAGRFRVPIKLMQMDDLFDLSWCKYNYKNFILIAMHRLLLKKETCIKNKTDKKGNAMWFSNWIVIVTI